MVAKSQGELKYNMMSMGRMGMERMNNGGGEVVGLIWGCNNAI
jgi:hypothetical protein